MNKRIMYYERDIKKEIRTSIKKMCVTPENTEPWLLDALFPTMRMFLENDFLENEEENQEARNKMDTCYSLDFDMSTNPEDVNTARRLLTLLLGNEDAKKMLCCQYQWMLQRNENNILSTMKEQKEKNRLLLNLFTAYVVKSVEGKRTTEIQNAISRLVKGKTVLIIVTNVYTKRKNMNA